MYLIIIQTFKLIAITRVFSTSQHQNLLIRLYIFLCFVNVTIITKLPGPVVVITIFEKKNNESNEFMYKVRNVDQSLFFIPNGEKSIYIHYTSIAVFPRDQIRGQSPRIDGFFTFFDTHYIYQDSDLFVTCCQLCLTGFKLVQGLL